MTTVRLRDGCPVAYRRISVEVVGLHKNTRNPPFLPFLAFQAQARQSALRSILTNTGFLETLAELYIFSKMGDFGEILDFRWSVQVGWSMNMVEEKAFP